MQDTYCSFHDPCPRITHTICALSIMPINDMKFVTVAPQAPSMSPFGIPFVAVALSFLVWPNGDIACCSLGLLKRCLLGLMRVPRAFLGLNHMAPICFPFWAAVGDKLCSTPASALGFSYLGSIYSCPKISKDTHGTFNHIINCLGWSIPSLSNPLMRHSLRCLLVPSPPSLPMQYSAFVPASCTRSDHLVACGRGLRRHHPNGHRIAS